VANVPGDASVDAEGAVEHHTRVVCHLPCNNTAESKAITSFAKYLEAQRTRPFGLKGYTKSVTSGRTFTGYWRRTTRGKFLQENVVLFLIDYEHSLESQAMLDNLARMKQSLQGWYLEFTGKPQEEIWMVAHPIARVV
jgi:hypothetical protein